ncbi:protein Abitram-like [Ruditapes philippinarum]|uniref:protein Abitram-like n=1 Tax=Ruditapes philippinarum TaxID=129788 RepID=UPI00295BF5BE|nr:protein Abitram-like [Ruditapes philippinarum]
MDNMDKYLTVTERYFTQKYYKNTKDDGEDLCVLVHSNKICIICLAETHPIVKGKKAVISVDYQFDKVNRLCNKVSGKGKKGGQNLTADALLCRVLCEDGSKFYIPCGLKCQLLETNDSLKKSPTTLIEKHLSDGYIAIVMPKLKEFSGEMMGLLSKEAYFNEDVTASVSSK